MHNKRLIDPLLKFLFILGHLVGLVFVVGETRHRGKDVSDVFPGGFQGCEQGIVSEIRLEAGTAIHDPLLPLSLVDGQRAKDIAIDMAQGLEIFAGRNFSPSEIAPHNGDGTDGVGDMAAGI